MAKKRTGHPAPTPCLQRTVTVAEGMPGEGEEVFRKEEIRSHALSGGAPPPRDLFPLPGDEPIGVMVPASPRLCGGGPPGRSIFTEPRRGESYEMYTRPDLAG